MSMLIMTSEIAFNIFAWYTTCLQSKKPVSIMKKSTIKHLKVLWYLSTVSLILKANKFLEISPNFWIIFWNILKRSFLITFDVSRFHICYFITFWFYMKGNCQNDLSNLFASQIDSSFVQCSPREWLLQAASH